MLFYHFHIPSDFTVNILLMRSVHQTFTIIVSGSSVKYISIFILCYVANGIYHDTMTLKNNKNIVLISGSVFTQCLMVVRPQQHCIWHITAVYLLSFYRYNCQILQNCLSIIFTIAKWENDVKLAETRVLFSISVIGT